MDIDILLFWNGVYFLGLFLLWLSFFLLTDPIKNLERSTGKRTHYKYLLLALGFLLIRPLMVAYSGYFSTQPLGEIVGIASVLAVLIGSLLVFIPIVNLAKRSITDSIGMGTWLFYLQISIIAFVFVVQTPNFFSQISSATYFIAALVLGLSLRVMSNFTEQFEIMLPLRWMFDSAAWLLPIALTIKAYATSVELRFESVAVAGYVSGELRGIAIFLLFVSGLISFIAVYTLKRAVMSEPRKTD
ncbi:hypothetical protein HY989_05600 [Candidatus Micrarchaeota archaeon]|nr:hypothetical protein [Candidatus Micrarchaeota archaeon]